MDIVEECMTVMVKKGERKIKNQAGLSGPKLGRIIRPWRIFSQVLPKCVKIVDRLGTSLEYTIRPKERPTGTTKTPRSKQINLTRTSPLGLGDVKFTLTHWRNCLEELDPEEKESTGLEDRPDPAAGEALASKGSPWRWWRREKGLEVEELPKWVVHPDPPFL
jgi:hypothetical protein